MADDKALETNDQEPEPYVEVDPSGRFGRYNTLLRSCPLKKVYKAFDEYLGAEVAWTRVELEDYVKDDPNVIDYVVSEVLMWKRLNHDNVVTCHKVWKDVEHVVINFVSQIGSSGSLRNFRKKYRRVSSAALKRWLKRWAKQILEGLKYLHTHNPCVIHADLTCSNIYVDGSTSEIKIGYPSFGAMIGQLAENGEAFSETPEFTAPELVNADFTEAVDIYSFGMCLLELATLEIPYSECGNNAEEIHERASKGIPPEAMSKVSDPEIKAFIERCIAHPIDRPSASELLTDPFFNEMK